VVSPSASGQMRIRYKDIAEHYNNPKQFFGEGKKVELTVYDIDYGKKRVSLIVLPAK
jgi:ribosomal protein S1